MSLRWRSTLLATLRCAPSNFHDRVVCIPLGNLIHKEAEKLFRITRHDKQPSVWSPRAQWQACKHRRLDRPSETSAKKLSSIADGTQGQLSQVDLRALNTLHASCTIFLTRQTLNITLHPPLHRPCIREHPPAPLHKPPV